MATADTSAQPAPPVALRIALIVIAAIATLSGISEFSGIFYDFGHTHPLLVFAQRVTSANLIAAPFIAGAALVLAALGRVRGAIVALAVRVLAAWVAELPSIPLRGLELPTNSNSAFVFAHQMVLPLLGVVAIVFAVRNTHLILATVFVTLPMVLTGLGVAAVVISVAIYGF
jgi:hypothetical protein